MKTSNRKIVQDLIPIDYETEDGTKFQVQKRTGRREDPQLAIPYVAMTWGDARQDPDNKYHDKTLRDVRTYNYSNLLTAPIDGYITITDETAAELVFTATSKMFFGVELSVAGVGNKNRVYVRISKKREMDSDDWETLATTWLYDHSIYLNNWTFFPMVVSTIKGEEYKIEAFARDLYNKGIYLKIATSSGVLLHRILGYTGVRKKYGGVGLVDLDLLLGVGDYGLLGGTKKITSEEIAWTIWQQIYANANNLWDPEIPGAGVVGVSDLRRVGSEGEETDYNFAITFRFEHGSVSKEPVYPIDTITLTKLYLKTELGDT